MNPPNGSLNILSLCHSVTRLIYIVSLLFVPWQKVVAAKHSMEYYHYNHQGSLLEVYDGTTGKRLLSQAWSPWGERQVLHSTAPSNNNSEGNLITHGLPAHMGYTGHKALLATSLIFAGDTRLYDPRLKRFLNTDDRTTGGVRGQNRYSYAYNNPMTYIDPNGRSPRRMMNRWRQQNIKWRSLVSIHKTIMANLAVHHFLHHDARTNAIDPHERRNAYILGALQGMQRDLENVAASKITAHISGFVTRKKYAKVLHFLSLAKENYNVNQRLLGTSDIQINAFFFNEHLMDTFYSFFDEDPSYTLFGIFRSGIYAIERANDAAINLADHIRAQANDAFDIMSPFIDLPVYNPTADLSHFSDFYNLRLTWLRALDKIAAIQGIAETTMGLFPGAWEGLRATEHGVDLLNGIQPIFMPFIHLYPHN